MRFASAITFLLVLISSQLVVSQVSIAQYLCNRLVEIGTNTVFSVTGDFSFPFLGVVEDTPGLERVGNNAELDAAYAAWAYAHVARNRAPGVVSVTYGPGSYPTISAIGGAMRENMPVIVISGAPGTVAWQYYDSFGADVHHQLEGPPTVQRDVFRPVTVAQEIINNPATAGQQIDALILTCLIQNRPVYLEVLVDLWKVLIPAPVAPLTRVGLPTPVQTIQANVDAAVAYTLTQLKASKFPIIFVSLEIKIYDIQALFNQFVTQFNVPYYTNYAGKGILKEPHPQFTGLLGTGNPAETAADFLLEVGTTYDDNSKTTASFSPNAKNWVRARRGKVDSMNRNLYNNVPLEPFLRGLIAAATAAGYYNPYYNPCQSRGYPTPTADPPASNLTYGSFVNHLLYAGWVNNSTTLVVDTTIQAYYMQKVVPIKQDGYVGDTFWLAIGWSGGAALGVKQALPDQRVLVIVGDGGFQNCPTGLGTSAELGHNTVVFIFHNNVYAIEQNSEDPTPYNNRSVPFFADNEIQDWNYAQFGASVGARSYRTYTHADLTYALSQASGYDGTTVIEIMLDKYDRPPQGNIPNPNTCPPTTTTGSSTTGSPVTSAPTPTPTPTAAPTPTPTPAPTPTPTPSPCRATVTVASSGGTSYHVTLTNTGTRPITAAFINIVSSSPIIGAWNMDLQPDGSYKVTLYGAGLAVGGSVTPGYNTDNSFALPASATISSLTCL